MSSSIPNFYKLSPKERLDKIREIADLTDEEIKVLAGKGLGLVGADRMIENVVGTFEIPVGIATNFLIDGVDRLIPMAIEESSVVAAASKAAKIARKGGGFKVRVSEPVMIGQIQVCNLSDMEDAKKSVLKAEKEILKIANEQDRVLVEHGGGAKKVEARVIETAGGRMLIVHLLVDCRDAMGANAVNTMAEAVAPYVEKVTGGRVYLRIISNLAVHRIAKAAATFPMEEIGEGAVDGILKASSFAGADPYRCATHNKGIMNGVSAVVLATGNDTRAVEAGAHAYASYRDGYSPLTMYKKSKDGDLMGSIELPVPVGVIGGATSVHPVAKVCRKILGVSTSSELGGVLAAVGLAQNFAALLALSTEGIQRGHMRLHARKVERDRS